MISDKGRAILRVAWCVLAAAHTISAGISCLSNPCLHGICIDDINSTYSCYCVDGYTGVQCQTNWDECWSSPCQNGGTCIDGIASYNCSCPDGFIGDNCETNFNECESNPCMNNGTCIDMTNGYVCSCVPGFSGQHCEMDVAVCNSSEEVRCYNGGQCIEGPGFKFYCKCMAGWAGPKCEDQIDECESNPCQNGGVCIDVHADYMCACAFGYTGKSCEVQIEFCDENSCSNEALCVVEDGMRVCYCVPDYHGERCELQYDECLLGPRCMNGGTCIDGVDNFTCSCPPRLTGTLCECLILDDGTYDCEYVSPTPLPEITQSIILTTYEDLLTTDSSVIYTIGHNDSKPRNITMFEETELSTLSTSPGITTTTETSMDTTSETTVTKETTHEETTPIFTVDYTSVKEITSMTSFTQGMDSKTEATTECKESCTKPTEYTAKVPTIDEAISSAMTTEPTKADSKLTTTTETTELTTITTTTEAVSTTTETPMKEITAEVTTTPKGDTTTEKMFTDTPTEHVQTDYPTPIVYTTTEAMEVVTGFDNSTYGFTTVQSECSDTVCNNHGTCINTPHGIRCHCTFNYGGRFCDEKIVITSAAFGGASYITHSLRNDTSIVIEFNAKTLITEGQIMHVDIAKGVYMQLFMVSGLLKFKFSCGYQTMLLSELKTFVNKGYLMKIETRLDLYLKEQHCNATLRLNDTVAMSGGQVANISSLNSNTTLYLGNNPDLKDSDNKPFIGCITDLIVNGERRELFGEAVEASEVSECSSLACLSGPCLNGGSCSDSGSGYTCSCANGWTGVHCNESVCENNPCHAGGSCVRHPGSGFLCLCPYGRHGIFCEYNVEITRPSLSPISTGISSYLMYPLSPSAINSDRFDLRLRFQTSDMDQIALLAFVGQAGRHDSRSQHLALTFVKGYIMLTWNMGTGPRRVFTSRALSFRRGGHTVRVFRRGRTAGLTVDGRHNVSGNAPAHDNKMTTLPYIFIGGHPSEGFRDLPHDLPLHTGWRGCVWEVGGPSVGAGKALGGRGVGQCGVAQCTAKSCHAPNGVCIHSPATYGCICNEGWFGATCASTSNPCDRAATPCRGRCVVTAAQAHCDCPYGKTGTHCDQDLMPTDVLFTGTRSYIQLHPRPISSVAVSFEAEVKPSRERGLMVFAETPHFYSALSLQGGLLEYRWTDRLSGVTSLVRSGVVVSMSQWHSVKAGRYGSRLYVWVDGAISTEAMLAHAYPHTASNASVLLGGAKDLSALPFDVMSGPPESFSGCIRNLHVNNILLPLEEQNIQEGQNVADCDGTSCGGEVCGGGTCVVEQGRARCVCGGPAGGGGRCRRHTGCSRATCGPPAGHCRKGQCVCAAGYTGLQCDSKVNVTIPQFTGESLLSLGRRTLLNERYSGEQRIASTLFRPSYLALNFTTAEQSGLLLWAIMDNDYLGIGLENGFLKLVWSFSNDNYTHEMFTEKSLKTPEPSRLLTRLVPHAGFLTDGEWHLLVVRLDRENITLTVDQTLAYVEEPGLRNELDYEDVDVFIGGINEEESSIAKKIFPDNFKGCIDQISTKEEFYMNNYTDVYSENVKSCQLFPLS
ncbi:protein eyes shut [Ostrinia furnacalis]|uniref:protein eyes shut n=1 Tax=Ostrinia furnacalis TaxID=93504 RepID=UPI001040C5F6|nr:protein eyes shut [Ostrinia furnacalis]